MDRDTVRRGEDAPARRAHGPASRPPALVRIAEVLLLAAALAGFLKTLDFAAHLIPQPFSMNFEEGNILNASLRVTRGQTPYPAVGGLPYVVDPYGPVFYYAVAPLVKWFGLSFTAPRLLVLASSLAVALFLVLLLRRWTGSWMIGFGFGLSFLAVSLVRTWTVILRVDMFGLAIAMAGLYVFAAGERLAWAAALFVAALFAKITLIAAPIACFFYLFFGGVRAASDDAGKSERRRAWRFAAWVVGFGVAGLLALGLGTGGWGIFDMFLTHPDPYSIRSYLAIIRPFALLDAALLAAVVALAIGDVRRRAFSLPLSYFLLAGGMTFTAGKFGSDANHLLEWQAAMCLAAGCGYASLRRHTKSDPVQALIPIGIVLLILLGLPQSRQLSPALAGCQAAYRFAAEQPGALLSENPGAAVLSGKQVWLSNSFEYAFLGKDGRLDQEPLNRLLRQRYFGLVLMGDNLATLDRKAAHPTAPGSIWPPAFVSALAQNYHQVATFACADASAAFEPNAEPGAAPAHPR